MSITAETAKAHANDPAVLCCRAEEGITIEPANLEDPAIFDELVDSGLISADDLHLIHVTKNPAEAMEHIDRFYRIFHSYRFVGDSIVIRLNAQLPAQWVEHLERDFSDLILPGGKMIQSGPLPDEADEPHLDRLPRLVFPIKRGNYGRLRLLIDRINQTPSRTYSPPTHA